MTAELVLAMLQEALSDPVFAVDYKRLYPVVSDIDLVHQACPDLSVFQEIDSSNKITNYDLILGTL